MVPGPLSANSDYITHYLKAAPVPLALGVLHENVESGVLMAIMPDAEAEGEQVALLVQRILNGEEAGSIAVERTGRFQLGINLATAQEAGVVFPSGILRLAKGHLYH